MNRLPFRYLEPYFFSGLLDDPVLYVRARPSGRAILVDCGQIHHLAKRVIRSLDAVFVSHPHMDHFMGFDTLVRHTHVAPRTLDLFGPPGIIGKAGHRLAGYEWNLTEEYWCDLRVHEVHAGAILTTTFRGAAGFVPGEIREAPREGRTIWRDGWMEVGAELMDHKTPCLAFRITERASFLLDAAKMAREGVVPGPWLRELKKRFYSGGGGTLKVPRREGEGTVEAEEDAAALFAAIREEGTRASVGYLTDVGFTSDNVEKARSLLSDATLLLCECTFLSADRDKARESHHLCTDDLSCLARQLRPSWLMPMHLSKSYVGRTSALYDELDLPSATRLLRLPEHVAPRPIIAEETPSLKW